MHTFVDLIPLLLIFETEQECRVLRQARHPVHLGQFELKADFEEFEAPMEELCEVGNLVVDDLLVVEVVVGLEVDASVCDEEKTFNFD